MATLLNRWKKKRFFKGRIRNTQYKMWDAEFLLNQLKGERENWRIEYNKKKEAIHAATQRLETEKKKEQPDKTICDQLENLVKTYTSHIQQCQKKMDSLDFQIHATRRETATEKNPEGISGVQEGIDGLRNVIRSLKDFMKTL